MIVLVLAAAAYPAWLGFRIWDQSREDELRPADAIVVLGAAQYDGRPSRVFSARLDHAAYLYREGFSGTVVVTGGKASGDSLTEAEAGERYLEARRVPSERIVAVAEGRTTLESLRELHGVAHERGLETLLLVSDPLHSERIKSMAADLGFTETYASPASYVELNRSRATKAKELLHEVASLAAYELLYR